MKAIMKLTTLYLVQGSPESTSAHSTVGEVSTTLMLTEMITPISMEKVTFIIPLSLFVYTH